jgi:hypothetical protein
MIYSKCLVAGIVFCAGLQDGSQSIKEVESGSSSQEVAAAQDVVQGHARGELPEHAIWRFGGDVEKPGQGIFRLAYSPNGKYLAARDSANIVTVRNVRTRQPICEVAGHDGWIVTLEFSPDSKHFLTATTSNDESIKIWQTSTGSLVETLDVDAITAVFSSDNRSIYVLGPQDIHQYSWPEVSLIQKRTWNFGADIGLGISRSGRYVIASYRTNNNMNYLTKVVDLENESSLMLEGPSRTPRTIVLSDNNVWVAAAYHGDSRIRLWNLQDPESFKYVLDEHAAPVQSISISDDNRFLISASWDRTSTIWDLLTQQRLGVLQGHTEHVTATEFSPCDMSVATGAAGRTDGSAIVWSYRELLFPKPPAPVDEANFERAWIRLGSNEPAIALDAVNDLRHSADGTLQRLAKRLGLPQSELSQEMVLKWIALLDNPSYDERQRATNELQKMRGTAEPFLRNAFDDTPSAEVRYRIASILRQPVERPEITPAELRRLYRTVHLLELLAIEGTHSQWAIDLLNSISTRHSHIDISRDAAAALNRIEVQRRGSFSHK